MEHNGAIAQHEQAMVVFPAEVQGKESSVRGIVRHDLQSHLSASLRESFSAPLRLCGKPKTGAWYSASLLRESASVSLPLRRKQSFFRKESEYVATPVAVFAQAQGRFPPQFELFMFVKKKTRSFLLDTGRGRPVASLPSLPETALWQLLSTSVFPFRDARRTVHKQRRTQGVNPLSHSPWSSHSPVEPPDDEIFQTFL